ncbi:cysteine hydrolase family protein [Actinoplanes sp. NPDC049265]|uniref:cysteine hydrolase family protein n=1 Tax=Actinoplanes sp. NPDC049265 TaxID=3363902 RepID=UPI00371EA5C1
MTTLEGRERPAVLVIDVQNGVVAGAFERDRAVGNVARLVDKARSAGVPVVWVQHSDDGLERGSDDWRIVPELVPAEGEAVVQKHHGDSFEGTDLEQVLAGLGVGALYLSGAETDGCVRSTLHGAFARGYDTYLIGDAHTAGDKSAWGAPSVEGVIQHTNLYWRYQTAPGKSAGVLDTDEVDFTKS